MSRFGWVIIFGWLRLYFLNMNYINVIEHKLVKSLPQLKREIDSGRGLLVTFLNPYSYVQLKNYPSLIESIDLILIDGIVLSKFLGVVFRDSVDRLSFDNTSVAPFVFKDMEIGPKKLFVIGSTADVIDKFKLYVGLEYPKIATSYFRNGFFQDENERDECIKYIAEVNPDYVIVGMGAPLQEFFLADLIKKGWNGVGFTCGGFLHQTARKGHNYYPKAIDRLNIRWLYRIFDEPKLLKRYLFDYSKFLLIFTIDSVKYFFVKFFLCDCD